MHSRQKKPKTIKQLKRLSVYLYLMLLASSRAVEQDIAFHSQIDLHYQVCSKLSQDV